MKVRDKVFLKSKNMVKKNMESRIEEQERKTASANNSKELVAMLLVAILFASFMRLFVFCAVLVDGRSMNPTLYDGDRCIVTMLGYTPKQGDVIVLDSAYNAREEYFDELARSKNKEELNIAEKVVSYLKLPDGLYIDFYIKRVIAVPGQVVDIHDGNVYVDGVLLNEPYCQGTTMPTDTSISYPLTVADNTVFVMGDNREHSVDSRTAEIGLVPYDAILGKAQIRFWPTSGLGKIR